MDEIHSHHLETMVNHFSLVFTGESSCQGFFGGAGFRPSTVFYSQPLKLKVSFVSQLPKPTFGPVGSRFGPHMSRFQAVIFYCWVLSPTEVLVCCRFALVWICCMFPRSVNLGLFLDSGTYCNKRFPPKTYSLSKANVFTCFLIFPCWQPLFCHGPQRRSPCISGPLFG